MAGLVRWSGEVRAKRAVRLKLLWTAVVGVLAFATAAPSRGVTLGVVNTGTGSPGTVDPNYTVISSPDPTYPGPAVFVTTSLQPAYLPNNTTSRWIDLNANGNTFMAN